MERVVAGLKRSNRIDQAQAKDKLQVHEVNKHRRSARPKRPIWREQSISKNILQKETCEARQIKKGAWDRVNLLSFSKPKLIEARKIKIGAWDRVNPVSSNKPKLIELTLAHKK
ncbi:hypothetical protein PoB_000731300 [Plakobranchus ocellatus]|uniref:Uncharacterized protein n=1 Tax=Plakobranchus ocellatus TaxID=259542 RepID=A0AAV3YEA7_9GAST|nr:hypothetical protein PoB_000731300 [Plakobranchus ocellatus]